MLPEWEEPVVKEWCDKVGFAHEDHNYSEWHEEHLMESHQPQNVPWLELHKADEHPGAPPRVLTQGVQQGEGVGGKVKESEEKDWHQDQRDGSSVEEQHGEH